MGSIGLWTRWILRDIRSRWIQVISIAFVIALGTGTYSGLSSTTSWRLKSNAASFDITNMHDLKVTLNTGSFTPAGTLKDTLAPLIESGLIVDIEERLSIPTQVQTKAKDGIIMVPGRLVGMDFSDGGPHIDSLYFTEGQWIGPRSGGRRSAVVEHTFAQSNKLLQSPVLELPGGTELQVVGNALSPEHFIAMDESGFGLNQGGYAVIFVPNETVQSHSGLSTVVNDAVIIASEETDIELLRGTVTSLMEKSLPDHGLSVSIREEDRTYRLLYEGADADQQFYHVIGLAILAGAVFAAFNLTSRIVQAQRREIGIGMALGTPGLTLALRPFVIGFQISLLGVLMGVGVGVLLNATMRTVLEATLPLPVWLTPFEIKYFIWVALGGFVAPVAAILIPILFGIRVRPIDAIRSGHLAPIRKGLAPLMSKVPLPGNIFWQMPFRNLLRSPKRSGLTLLGISAVIAVMISVLGMVDSIVNILDTATIESEGNRNPRLEVTLDRFIPTNSAVINTIDNHSLVKSSQPVLRFGGTLTNKSKSINILVAAIDSNNSLWMPTIEQGRLPDNAKEIMLSTTAARNLGVVVGDSVVVERPVMTGATSLEFQDTEFVVSGLHPHPMRSYAYVHISQALEMGMVGIAQSVWIEPLDIEKIIDLKRSLFAIQGVAAVVESAEADRATAEAVEDQIGILKVVQFVVLGLALLIAFNTASINMDDRAREHATMMAFGLSIGKIMRMAIVESAAMGMVASCIGIGLGLLLLNYFVYTVFPTVMPEVGLIRYVSLETYLITMALGVIAVGIAPLLTIRKLLKTNIPSTLRILE